MTDLVHTGADVDLQPNDLEAMQAETDDPGPAARVQIVGIDGPVRTQELPRKAASTIQKVVGATQSVQILRADHRRAIARVVSVGQNVYVAFSQAAAQEPQSMALWPQNVPLLVTADAELWVRSSTGTTTVSVVAEFWAVGA